MTATPQPAPPAAFASLVAEEAGTALAAALAAALDQVAEALAEADPVEMVHDVRKALKAYRALLRLVPGPEAEAARARASDAARGLSASRDRQAALDALEALADAGLLPPKDAKAAAAVIAAQPEAAEQATDQRVAIQDFLDHARASLADGLAAAARRADVVAGLSRAYRRARADPDWSRPEGLHALRKRVVAHRYQMDFFADFCGAGAKRARKAQRLRDILGIHQDLEALKPRLAGALGTAHEALMSEVAAAGRALQRRLVRQAKAGHARLFRAPAKAFAARLARRMEGTGAPAPDAG